METDTETATETSRFQTHNGNRYLTRASNGNVIFITATGNVYTCCQLGIVPCLFLDLVMIQ